MARIGLPKADAAGLYMWLLAREEAAAASPGGMLSGQFGGEGPWSYDHVPARLEALRAGQPVNVPFNSLPKWAKAGAPRRKSARGLVDIYPQRAIVGSDDSVVWSDDGWARQWLEEHGEL
jgi:hypothetical protein